jgi:hypothetical protein
VFGYPALPAEGIMRSLLIIALSAALAFTCHRLAEIENQRYALLLGMCHQQDSATPYDFECIVDRASLFWPVRAGALTAAAPPSIAVIGAL